LPSPVPNQPRPPQPGAAPQSGNEPVQHEPIRVLVVDDHPIWRNAAARDLAEAGFDVVGTAGDGAQALRVATATRPRVVLLDLNLPDLPGPEVIRGLLTADAGIRILMLSASGERQDVLDAVTAGACGYLLKSAQLSELVAGVRATAAGQAVFTPGLAGLVLGEYRRLARDPAPPAAARPAGSRAAGRPGLGPTPELTDREAEILRLVAKGLTYPQIAARLTLSTRTVQNHVQNTLSKLQLHNKAQLVRYALEQGVD
jgi:DNA-binding NarL/FixJ family response regulator